MKQRALRILDILEDHGHDAYLVGGCVRDLLLQRVVHDIDICTSALPEQVCQYFKHVIPTGIKHGTVTVILEGIPFEVTTFRSESKYKDHRHPDQVHFHRSLKADLARRDFTMNALAMNKQGVIFDFFQGRKHMLAEQIHTVGPAGQRFTEDALRIMRAIRFSAQLGFTLSEEVIEAARTHAHLLNYIAVERLTDEFRRMMAAPFCGQALFHMGQCQVSLQVQLFEKIKEGIRRTGANTLHDVLSELKEIERWLLLLSRERDVHKRIAFIHALRLPKAFYRPIRQLVELQHQYVHYVDVHEFSLKEQFDIGLTNLEAILKINHLNEHGHVATDLIKQVREAYEQLKIHDSRQLQVSGLDLIEHLQKKGGPWVGAMLDRLIQAVLDSEVVNKHESLLHFAAECDRHE